jgi:hypothetical protein
MEMQATFRFGIEREWRAFADAHGDFMKRFPSLLALIDQTFIRPVETCSRADSIVFFLGRLIVEDFMEVVLLCGNGYGVAALKILRGMYERVVTASYLSKNPTEVDDFLGYGHVQEWKLLKRISEVYGDKSPISVGRVNECKRAYELVKAKFDEVLCKKCGTTRSRISWSKLDTGSMALSAGNGLDQLYMSCYLVPTLQAHATVSSLAARIKEATDGGPHLRRGCPARSGGLGVGERARTYASCDRGAEPGLPLGARSANPRCSRRLSGRMGEVEGPIEPKTEMIPQVPLCSFTPCAVRGGYFA